LAGYTAAVAVTETLVERRKQAAIDEIARAALDLVAQSGFEATSVEAIAAAVGCSPRTIYRYFGTKEDVLFHDVPAAIEQLGRDLEHHLAEGLGPWAAVCESVVDFIAGFDVDDEHRVFPIQRMNLWLSEPALRARYMQLVAETEQVITDVLCHHRGSKPEQDELPLLIAIAATGATRITFITHTQSRKRQKLSKHLRRALATLGRGLDDEITGAS
jgi:AcrR family transcriptional regulator